MVPSRSTGGITPVEPEIEVLVTEIENIAAEVPAEVNPVLLGQLEVDLGIQIIKVVIRYRSEISIAGIGFVYPVCKYVTNEDLSF
jgi:hypothetical protein